MHTSMLQMSWSVLAYRAGDAGDGGAAGRSVTGCIRSSRSTTPEHDWCTIVVHDPGSFHRIFGAM